jgi:hypothetical protein
LTTVTIVWHAVIMAARTCLVTGAGRGWGRVVLITPEEVADAVDLCVRSAAITGQGINVDGGAVQS